MADDSFTRAKKSSLSVSAPNAGAEVGCGRKGKGTTIPLMMDGKGTPLSAFTTAATISEVHAIETLTDLRATAKQPARLMYGKAADADWLRETLGVRGIALICPHREPPEAAPSGRPCDAALQTPVQRRMLDQLAA